MSSRFVTINKEVNGRYRIVERPDSDHGGNQDTSPQSKTIKKFTRGNTYKEDPISVSAAWRELVVKPCNTPTDEMLLRDLDLSLNMTPPLRNS